MMVNLDRRKRQARENADNVVNKFIEDVKNGVPLRNSMGKQINISNVEELETVIKRIETEINEIVVTIEPDWAIPVIIEIIGRIYYGKLREFMDFGTTFKRSLAYLWNSVHGFPGEQKNIAQLVRLLHRCCSLETLYNFRKLYWAIDGFYFFFQDGYCVVPDKFLDDLSELEELMQGRGRRFRIAEVNSNLMNYKGGHFYNGIISVLKGNNPRQIPVFKNTFYEYIPGIKNEECHKFWQMLLFLYMLYTKIALSTKDGEDGTGVVLFPEIGIVAPEGYFTQETICNSFWRTDWFEKQLCERYGNLIVDRPIVRISQSGVFATSFVLIGDAINFFVEKQLLSYKWREKSIKLPDHIFKDAFSGLFEKKCINFFRDLGFIAGQVTDQKIWKTQTENIDMRKAETKLYGEIDVLAYHPEWEMLLLIECKVLKDVEDSESYKNLVAKLRDDSEGFRSKLLDKAKWLQEAFALYYGKIIEPCLVLLTDIPLPVIGLEDDSVLYTNYIKLTHAMLRIAEERRDLF